MTKPGWRRVVVSASVILILSASTAIVGCGSQTTTTAAAPQSTSTTGASTTSSAPTSSATSATTASTTVPSSSSTTAPTTTTTEPLTDAEHYLPNGNIAAMGYISDVRVSGGIRYLRIDFAVMLTGEEANEAAIEAGVIAEGETIDNDYFIRNVNPLLREYRVSDTAVFTTETYDGVVSRAVTWDEFLSFWSASPPGGGTHMRNMPWWIERDGTTIVSIAEQFLP